jgi:4-carboxymuconolactone decarboxylase
MADHNTEPSGAQRKFGDFGPALVGYTDDVLFGQVWMRPELSPKGTQPGHRRVPDHEWKHRAARLSPRPRHAKGASEQELIEVITHLAFYAGWPKAMSAMGVAKQVFAGDHAD